MAGKIVRRSQRVAFMNVDATGEAPKYERMTGFTTFTSAKNPKEYNRQYVDEDAERGDVVGYAPSIDYSFDRHTNTPVHDHIAKIQDGELLGSDTHVEIIVVDLFTKDESDVCEATKRTYSIIPNSDGDGTEALIYSGSMKSVSGITKGTAVVSEDGMTATFTPAE